MQQAVGVLLRQHACTHYQREAVHRASLNRPVCRRVPPVCPACCFIVPVCLAQVSVCKEQVEWAIAEKRTFLRQRIQLRLASLYLDTAEYQDALKIVGA